MPSSIMYQRTATGPAIVQAVSPSQGKAQTVAPTYARGGDTGMPNPDDGPVFMGLTRTQLMIGGGLALAAGAVMLAQRKR